MNALAGDMYQLLQKLFISLTYSACHSNSITLCMILLPVLFLRDLASSQVVTGYDYRKDSHFQHFFYLLRFYLFSQSVICIHPSTITSAKTFHHSLHKNHIVSTCLFLCVSPSVHYQRVFPQNHRTPRQKSFSQLSQVVDQDSEA